MVVFVLSRKAVSGLAAIATVDLQITNLICNLYRRRMRHAQSPLGFVQRGDKARKHHTVCGVPIVVQIYTSGNTDPYYSSMALVSGSYV